MRIGLLVLVAALLGVLPGCDSTKQKLAGPPKVTQFVVQSQLLGRPMYEELVTPDGGGKGRPLLVFLHGYGGTPSDTATPAFHMALRRLGDRAPVVMLPEGDTSWWHDREEGPWGTYVLMEAIPAALERSGADHDRVAIGGISMGGFGALDLGRLAPERFCAVGGHSPAVYERLSDDSLFGFDNQDDFDHHDLLTLARSRSPYEAPVWIDVGDQDFLQPAAEKLADELRDDGADVTFHVWPGAHAGQYWDRHFADYLDFYADACS
jgi:S-formylglutathione hydrolase FrmB